MQNANPFDKAIADGFREYAEKVEAPDDLKSRIMADLCSQNKERFRMKNIVDIKKVVGIAAAFTVLCSAGAFAASNMMRGSISTSSHDASVTEYAQAVQMPGQLGYQTNTAIPETLGDFRFKEAVMGQTTMLDDNGKKTDETFKELSVFYTDSANKMLSLHVGKTMGPNTAEEISKGAVTKQVGDITLCYNADKYVFLSEEKNLSEEDKTAMDRGEIYVSYGGDAIDEREEKTIEHVLWESGGVAYILMGSDTGIGADRMLEMAQEWLNTK